MTASVANERRFPSPQDLLWLLEVARTGRVTAAATRLEVDHTTVSRRISRLEKRVGTRLFDRRNDGWTLTDAGERLRRHAEEIESSVLSAAESVAAQSPSLSGAVRIVAPDGFGAFLLPHALTDLRRNHPGLVVEVVTESGHVSLNSRGFDVAVTLELPPSRAVHSSELARYRLGLYASRTFLTEHGPIGTIDDLDRVSLIYYVDDRLDVEPLRMLHQVLPGRRAAVQFNSISGQLNAAAAGLGVGLLPCYIARTRPDLVRLLERDVSVERTYWITVPRELARTARVVAVVDQLNRLVNHSRAELSG